MTDALTDAVDSWSEELTINGLKDFSLEEAHKIKHYLDGMRYRNREKAQRTLFEQISFYLKNQDLNHLMFSLGGRQHSSRILYGDGLESYLQHIKSCKVCSQDLSKYDLTPEKISETLENIKKQAPNYYQ